MKTGIILQARTGSTRYPNKILQNIHGSKTLLEFVVSRIKQALPNTKLVIATTTNSEDDSICKISDNLEIDYFRGSEHNVLLRYINAAKQFNFTNIIRVCSDNPFIDIQGLNQLKDFSEKTNADYCGFLINNTLPSIKSHFGFWGETVKLAALEKVTEETNVKEDLEHVTKYIYEHEEDFNIAYINAPTYMTDDSIRLTIDTKEDLHTSKEILKRLDEKSIFNNQAVIDIIKDDKALLDKMVNEIQKHKK